MDTIDDKSTRRELVNWLRGESKNKIIAVVVIVNQQIEGPFIPLYLSKDGLLGALLKVDRDQLWSAIDQVFPDDDPCDDEDEDDYEDEEDDEIDAM